MAQTSPLEFGLAIMPEPGFAEAALPLFEAGIIEVVEWSFDMGWGPRRKPEWLTAVVDEYSLAGALLGHGVSYSLLGARGEHDRWLGRLRREVSERPFRWISEHVGFVGAGNFSFSAPLPLPPSAEVVRLGNERLASLANVVQGPVGVENLATCLGVADALSQGSFLTDLLEPVDGFLVLDLHNLWCQSINTGFTTAELLQALPLDRVREVHVSGGRWNSSEPTTRPIRRDTHDDIVPEEVHDLLQTAIERCPNLEVVIYERLGHTLTDAYGQHAYRDDVRRVFAATREHIRPVPTAGSRRAIPTLESNGDFDRYRALDHYQSVLLETLASGGAGAHLKSTLLDALPMWHSDVAGFDPELLEVAAELTRTWGRLGADRPPE